MADEKFEPVFKVGDLVMWYLGGVVMAVTRVEPTPHPDVKLATCEWFDGRVGRVESKFSSNQLVPIGPSSRP